MMPLKVLSKVTLPYRLFNSGKTYFTVALLLQNAFLRDGFLCRIFWDSSSSDRHVQIVVPHSFQNSILQQLHNQSGHLGVH